MASMMVCSVAVFLFPILLKKESFSDCMGCVVESYMMIIFLLVFLLVCWMALEYLDGLMHLEFITKQFSDYVNDTIYSIAIAVFICIICGFRLIDKEKLDGAEICTVFVLVCHAIIALAANEVVCFSVTVTLYLTVSIFLIALILTILSYKYGK